MPIFSLAQFRKASKGKIIIEKGRWTSMPGMGESEGGKETKRLQRKIAELELLAEGYKRQLEEQYERSRKVCFA